MPPEAWPGIEEVQHAAAAWRMVPSSLDIKGKPDGEEKTTGNGGRKCER